jgi:hypothetical protein
MALTTVMYFGTRAMVIFALTDGIFIHLQPILPMRKPIIEHLRDIADSDVRDRAVRNCDNPDSYEDNLSDAIFNGFSWEDSPEGKEYWSIVYEDKNHNYIAPFRTTLTDRIAQLETQHATLTPGSTEAAHLWDIRCEVANILGEWDKRNEI